VRERGRERGGKGGSGRAGRGRGSERGTVRQSDRHNHTRARALTHTGMHTHSHARTHARTHTRGRANTRTHTYTCTYTQHTHTHTHIHTHTHRASDRERRREREREMNLSKSGSVLLAQHRKLGIKLRALLPQRFELHFLARLLSRVRLCRFGCLSPASLFSLHVTNRYSTVSQPFLLPPSARSAARVGCVIVFSPRYQPLLDRYPALPPGTLSLRQAPLPGSAFAVYGVGLSRVGSVW